MRSRVALATWPRLIAPLLVIASQVSASGCNASARSGARDKKLVVFAAASLREAFTAMEHDFEQAHPRVELRFNFAGSQELRAQLEHGAAADVFASADRRHMDELATNSRVSAPVIFVRNEPVIIVAQESIGRVESIADLPEVERIVVGAEVVPIGRYTTQIFDRASKALDRGFRTRVAARVVSRELNVRQVLAKVALGEAQAGVVYRSDAKTAQVATVSIPREINVVAEYPIAVVTGAAHPELARAWVDFVLSPAGQRALRDAGFLPAHAAESSP